MLPSTLGTPIFPFPETPQEPGESENRGEHQLLYFLAETTTTTTPWKWEAQRGIIAGKGTGILRWCQSTVSGIGPLSGSTWGQELVRKDKDSRYQSDWTGRLAYECVWYPQKLLKLFGKGSLGARVSTESAKPETWVITIDMAPSRSTFWFYLLDISVNMWSKANDYRYESTKKNDSQVKWPVMQPSTKISWLSQH